MSPFAQAELGSVPEVRRRPQYLELSVRSFLRQEPSSDGGWRYAINPYEGCEHGCAFCQLRLDRKSFASWLAFEKRIAVKSNAAEVLRRELSSEEVSGHPLVIGSAAEAWQHAEEHFRLTRGILAVLAEREGLEVEIHTRSSLIARDSDLLRRLAARGRLRVIFSIASLDERVNRVLEPRVPSAFRRLAALEALSRAGIHTGLLVSPVMTGLDEEELGLEPLLIRAANAGARFAGVGLIHFEPGQRETFLAHATAANPEMASRYRRILGRKPPSEEERRTLFDSFARMCDRLGLAPLEQAPAPRSQARVAPAQLALFDPMAE